MKWIHILIYTLNYNDLCHKEYAQKIKLELSQCIYFDQKQYIMIKGFKNIFQVINGGE